MDTHKLKISVVGMGRVGSATAFALVVRGLAEELVLVDEHLDHATGEAFDLQHASVFGRPMDIRAGDYDATAGSDIVILCASAPVTDTSSRLKQAAPNAALFKRIVPAIARGCPGAILIVVTNPVDVMTYLALKYSGFAPSRVFGTGTLIDTARFRSLLSQASAMNSDDIRAYILGEHGDSQIPALSVASAGGVRFKEHDATVMKMFEEARQGGYRVIAHKGHTSCAIAMAISVIVDAIARNALTVLPVSVLIEGYLGVRDVCLSMPCVIGRAGVTRALAVDLSEEEAGAFRKSADMLRQVIAPLLCDATDR
jgi:L-lactate dehydrogenase